LKQFPSITAVLTASIDELKSVEGVGESVATYLRCIGMCLSATNDSTSFTMIKSCSDLKQFISYRFANKPCEFLEFYLLDRMGCIKRIGSYTSNSATMVTVATNELSKLLCISKPFGLFVAHNHLYGSAMPSTADDLLTRQIQVICNLNDIHFYDHCIYYKDDEIFSYFGSGRLKQIGCNTNVNYIQTDDWKAF
jgi:DNA repair protein RadC